LEQNYRAACLGKSQADFIAKLGIVQEESDESTYWMELLIDSGIISIDKIGLLKKESEEITAIITASIITSRQSKK
jgi:four helix bundle protein